MPFTEPAPVRHSPERDEALVARTAGDLIDMARRTAVILLLVAGLVLTSTPAHADSKTVHDHYNGSRPALNLKKVKFAYNESSAVIRVKMERLTRKRSMVVAKYIRRDGTTIQVATKYVRGSKRVLAHRYDAATFKRVPKRLVTVRWSFSRDVVRIVLHKELLRGRKAGFLAWSQPKRANHGSPYGRDQVSVGRLKRG